jgi:hypothetical protein
MRFVFVALALGLLGCGICSIKGGDTPVSAAEMERARVKELDRAGAGFEAFTLAPFVVVVDGGKSVRDEAEQTVAWARGRLRADFFAKEPSEPITVLVFPDEDRYMRGSSAILGTIPTTPYGFYRPCSKTLVVNAGYGWGTAVHEMVHAYLAADFPDAPQWLNEGLASLFEAPTDDAEGHIRGETNWRLAELQNAIAKNRAHSFHTLVKGSRWDFDGKEGPLYYAESRYLLYWLQEKGLLRPFYTAYRANVGRDRRGLETLARIAGRPLSEIRTDWEAFVMKLHWERKRG